MCVCLDQGGDGTAFYQVQAHMAMLDKHFKLAEMRYVEQVCEEEKLASKIQRHVNMMSNRFVFPVFSAERR